MNMISKLRAAIQKTKVGSVCINVEEFNQLQAEWITRAPISPPPFDDEVKWILGCPNFTCVETANVLRKMGRDIPKKAESEQAATLYYYLEMYLEHGGKWREKARAIGVCPPEQ